eukprot:scaffold1307_cov200-Pinguiococcus_pyrenoidosus.AAC.130
MLLQVGLGDVDVERVVEVGNVRAHERAVRAEQSAAGAVGLEVHLLEEEVEPVGQALEVAFRERHGGQELFTLHVAQGGDLCLARAQHAGRGTEVCGGGGSGTFPKPPRGPFARATWRRWDWLPRLSRRSAPTGAAPAEA